jgi:hypothetical protein
MNDSILTEAELEGQGLDSLESIFVEEESAFDDEPAKESETEKENSVESSTEKNETEKEPSQEGEPEKDNTPMEDNIPFHKHPRWQEMLNKNKELEEQLNEFKQGVSTQLEEIKTKPTEQIPESFRKLYGDDPVVWQTWKEYMASEKESWKKDTLAEIKAEQESKLKEEKLLKEKELEAQKYFENQFKEIEAADGKIDRNAIVKILETYHPVEPNTGLYDVKAAYDIYKKLNKVDLDKSNKRKSIADTTTSNGGSSSDQKPVAWDSIRNKGFGDF